MFKRFIKPVYAHCDIPCGIYETDTMTHAAATCRRMVELIDQQSGDDLAARNNFARMVLVKEKHAQTVKDQLYILWSDYFKPEHLKDHPDLHQIIWQAAKTASRVKQTVDMVLAEQLQAEVAEVARVFASTKK